MSSAAAVDAALGAAVEAQGAWAADAMLRSRSLVALGEAVAARREEFTALMVREVGKPVAEAEGEVERALAILRFYSQVALDPDGETLPGSSPGARVVVRREPLGVVLAICPWNFPLAIPLWKAAPALAYGNSVLLKPAAAAIATASLLADCAAEALPEAVLTGLVIPGSRAGELLDDERIAAVTFTGSTGTGISVAERMARRAAPAQAEMGGQNPAVVLEDADVDAAAAAIVGGAMGYAGQKCTATRRVIALAGVADQLEHRIAELVTGLEVGDPRRAGVTVGPLISADAVDEFEQAVASALGAGATETARAVIRRRCGRQRRRRRTEPGRPLRQPGAAQAGRPGSRGEPGGDLRPAAHLPAGGGRGGSGRRGQRDPFRPGRCGPRTRPRPGPGGRFADRLRAAADQRPDPRRRLLRAFRGRRPLQLRPARAGTRRARVLHLFHDDDHPAVPVITG